MSMFVCARCDSIRDSDDGCEEAPSPPYKAFSLLCVECADEEEEEREAAAEERGIDEQMAWYDTSEELK